jgi:CubicO group peptidase (beta-lactamase class C family)
MNVLRNFFFIISIFLILCTTGCRDNQKIEAALDTYVEAYAEQGLFSGSVLVAKDGKILLSKGYGMANYELDVPNTPQTKFRLGSITKQFTAMAIMQLQEQGLLSINDKVSKYIPDYPNGDKITIHYLLTHTSGIPNVTRFPEYKKKKLKPHTLEQLIERFKNKPLDFEPGEKFSYSNSGYILLSYIIEKASGKKYETILKKNIFDLLNMKNSGYDNYRLIIKGRASGYGHIDDELVNATYIDMSFPAGAGALYSTVENLYLWDQALYTEKLVSRKSLDEIFTPFKGNYGYGWNICREFNHEFMGHGGGIDGFTTDISRYPDANVCIIVLSNFENSRVLQLSNGLAAIVFGEKCELPKKRIAVSIDPEIYNQYVGKYKLKEDFIITVTKENNRLITQATGQAKFEIYPESETEFFSKIIDGQISFAKDKSGKVSKLILHQAGLDQVAERIE